MATLYSIVGEWHGKPLYGNSLDGYTTISERAMQEYLAGKGDTTNGTVGNDPTVKQLLYQKRNYTSILAVDALQGATVDVTPLEGDMQVATPLNAAEGFNLIFLLYQDANGNHNITWSPVFLNIPEAINQAPLSNTTLVFVYNGQKWV